jgi:polygalacturonase
MSMATDTQLATAIFNVRDYGLSGSKDENAQGAIQRAIDECAQAGGGVVYFPPGAYTTGTLHLRSHVRIFVEAGATIYSSKEPAHFDKRALFYGEDLENVTLEGRGTIDGQGEYKWADKKLQDWFIYPNELLAVKAGLPLTRSFPTDNSVGHLVLMLRCQDLRIQSLNFLHSPSWTMHLYGCQRVVIDGIYIYTNMRDGVWADGIDPDGCQDVRIANCTINTGDDAIVFYSMNWYGPALPCENITITNCRLSSSSSALKFCDGNMLAVRNVTVDNCILTASNRGIAFMLFDGGVVENVVLSNLVIECKRFDWFWWGDGDPIHFNLVQRSEIDPNTDKSKQPPVGTIRNVILSNIIAHGPGPCRIHGHVDSPLENITFDNVHLTVDSDPESPWHKAPVALTIENARNFRLKDVEINWQSPSPEHWQSALVVNNVHGLVLDGLSARQAANGTQAPAVVFNAVDGAVVKNCQAQAGSGTFLQVSDAATRDVVLWGNDLRLASAPLALAAGSDPKAVREGWS